MISVEDYKDNHTRIQQLGNQFFVYMDDEHTGTYDDKLEAEDILEDAVTDRLKEDNEYVCDFCNTYYNKDDIEFRIEDNRFTAPYGSTFVMGGSVYCVPVCPICRGDMEETR
jgi:hypothetical protein